MNKGMIAQEKETGLLDKSNPAEMPARRGL
jgi:hypothetical protein